MTTQENIARLRKKAEEARDKALKAYEFAPHGAYLYSTDIRDSLICLADGLDLLANTLEEITAQKVESEDDQ